MKWLLLVVCFLFFNPANAADFKLISKKQYRKLSDAKKTVYVRELRTAWLEFEQKYPHQFKKGFSFEQIFWERAFAGEETNCIIGGAVLQTVNGFCPTRTRSCDGGDNFQCGAIFGKTCVSREPLNDLSKRCYESSPKTVMSPETYDLFAQTMTDDYKNLCLDHVAKNTNDGCLYLTKRIQDIGKEKDFGVDENTEFNLSHYNIIKGQAVANPKSIKKDPKKMGGVCPNDFDPITNIEYAVPKFSVTPNGDSCTYARNKQLLADVAKNGCSDKAKQPGDELVKTMFRPPQGTICTPPYDCFDAIIEEVTVSGDDIEMQALKPNLRDSKLDRVNMHLKKLSDNKYQLIEANGKNGPLFEIENVSRTDIMTKYRSPTNDNKELVVQRLSEARKTMGSNCELSKELNKEHFYPAGSTAQPGSTSK